MEYRYLGDTGLRVSAISLGVATFGSSWGPHWTTTDKEASSILGTALDSGINLFDTSNLYNNGQSEEWLGNLLRGPSSSSALVATKYGYSTDPSDRNSGGATGRAMRLSVEQSLRRLKREAIDILYLHLWDRVTPAEELLATAASLVDAGKIRHFGLSNVPPSFLGECVRERHQGAPRVYQGHYNLLERHVELDILPCCNRRRLGFIAWGPLANGLLTGKYQIDQGRRKISGGGRMTANFTTGEIDTWSDATRSVLNSVETWASRTGLPQASVALNWLLAQPITSAALGVSSVDQLRVALDSIAEVLPPLALADLDRVGRPHPSYPYTFTQDDLQQLVHPSQP